MNGPFSGPPSLSKERIMYGKPQTLSYYRDSVVVVVFFFFFFFFLGGGLFPIHSLSLSFLCQGTG